MAALAGKPRRELPKARAESTRLLEQTRETSQETVSFEIQATETPRELETKGESRQERVLSEIAATVLDSRLQRSAS